jgi:hypothetical protein
MLNLRRTTATLGAAALVAAPLTLMTAAPASAAEREFRVAGADVDFQVEKDDGRFEVDVDIDDAQPGSRWRVVLWHDGKRFHKRVHTADNDGDVDIDKNRRNTAGKDVFKVKVKKIGGPKAKTRTIRLR